MLYLILGSCLLVTISDTLCPHSLETRFLTPQYFWIKLVLILFHHIKIISLLRLRVKVLEGGILILYLCNL